MELGLHKNKNVDVVRPRKAGKKISRHNLMNHLCFFLELIRHTHAPYRRVTNREYTTTNA